jgi:hypothetical protein
MKRRQALRNISLSIGGIISMPLWTSCWNKETLPSQGLLMSQEQEILLSEFVETLIPTTDTPGAKEIGVHDFIKTMVYDCYEEADQKEFVSLLEKINLKAKDVANKSFIDSTPTIRAEILNDIDKESKSSPEGAFKAYPYLKELSIQGYLSSEYVLTHIHIYELVPGRFDGSFPLKKA